MYEAPTPDGHGWEVKDSCLNVVWMVRLAAPAALLELTRCHTQAAATVNQVRTPMREQALTATHVKLMMEAGVTLTAVLTDF